MKNAPRLSDSLCDEEITILQESPFFLYCEDSRKIAVTAWDVMLNRLDVVRVRCAGILQDWRGTPFAGVRMFDGAVLVCPKGLKTDTGIGIQIVEWQVCQALDLITVSIHGMPVFAGESNACKVGCIRGS